MGEGREAGVKGTFYWLGGHGRSGEFKSVGARGFSVMVPLLIDRTLILGEGVMWAQDLGVGQRFGRSAEGVGEEAAGGAGVKSATTRAQCHRGPSFTPLPLVRSAS